MSLGVQEPQDWWPTIEQVAALLRARTMESGRSGDYADTFTTTTRPTASQVTELIALAAIELHSETSGRQPCSTNLRNSAGMFLLYRTCQLVEQSYQPEASDGTETLAQEFGRLADKALATAASAINARCPLPDDLPPIAADKPLRAVRRGWCGPTLGRRTVW